MPSPQRKPMSKSVRILPPSNPPPLIGTALSYRLKVMNRRKFVAAAIAATPATLLGAHHNEKPTQYLEWINLFDEKCIDDHVQIWVTAIKRLTFMTILSREVASPSNTTAEATLTTSETSRFVNSLRDC